MLAKCSPMPWVFTALILLFSITAMAQKKVSGTIVNAANQPIVGASVVVKGTNSGTTTDAQGRYSLTVPDGSNTLVLSSVGFASTEVRIDGRSSIDVTLAESESTISG